MIENSRQAMLKQFQCYLMESAEALSDFEREVIKIELKIKELTVQNEENKLLKDEIRHLVQSFTDTTSVQVVGLLNRNACRSIKEQNKYRCIYPERYATENYAFDPLNLVLGLKALSNHQSSPDASGNKPSSGQYWLNFFNQKLQLGVIQLKSMGALVELMKEDSSAEDSELEDSFQGGLQDVMDAVTSLY